MYRHTRPPPFPITFNQQFLILGFAGLTLTAITFPNDASAFWPFSTDADAAVNMITSNSGTHVLVAATNSDPDPHKGLGNTVQMSGGKALLAYVGPSGTMTNAVKSTQPGHISVYVVRAGDTLSEIANMFDISINTILWANDIKSARDVQPGDTLIILPVSGIERVVVKGDTLKSLAKKYNADADDIAEFNDLDPTTVLEVGSTIIIPDGIITAPSTSPSSYPPTRKPYIKDTGPLLAGYYSNPLPNGIITQGLHGWSGIDIGAARGTPIYAAAGGTAIVARNNSAWNGGYGNYVVLTHDNGTQTLYSHMKNTIIFPGQTILRGQIIGYVGATGRATGPHLHFEVRGAANPLRACRVGSICSFQ